MKEQAFGLRIKYVLRDTKLFKENILYENNIIVLKSKAFAVRTVKMYCYLRDEKKEYVMSKQVLRSGTSIGANVKEAVRGQTKADFYAKMNIALKEASETEYWLEILHETDMLEEEAFNSIYTDCQELLRLLMAITKSQKIKQFES